MARYDVFLNPVGVGYLLDVQTDLLEELSTRVVVPLVPISERLALVRRLNPIFVIDGKQYAMFTHLIATVPRARLGGSQANLIASHDKITEALDMVFQGF
ncbi:CcdB family protein [Aminobacter aganoensis]|uniref:Toxin CcdB n=1 Tax=Aminobacter aganoensis TaxID=83264 RepID=A0A7X0KMG0_9HYPH|nr:CcdB family protein [Aminobacter aganoensis]MBB6356097.1 toxin CcdB [Aminobacter aganoensis]